MFLICSNCVGKVGGVTRYSNLSFFDNFELILLQAAVTRKSVHALIRQSWIWYIMNWKKMFGKLQSSYGNHGNYDATVSKS